MLGLLVASSFAYGQEQFLMEKRPRKLGACAGKLTGVSRSLFIKPYNDKTLPLDLNTFISSTDPVGCPIEKCVLKDNKNDDGAECKKPDELGENDLYSEGHFTIQEKAPFQITMNAGPTTGYVGRLCIYCLSGTDSGYWEGVVSMRSQCGGTISLKDNIQMKKRVSPLADPKAVKVIFPDVFESFFNLANEAECRDRIECSLLNTLCTGPYLNNRLEVKRNTETKKDAMTTRAGLTETMWDEDICIKCKVDAHFIHLKHFKVSSSRCGEVLIETPKVLNTVTIPYSPKLTSIGNFASFFENRGDKTCQINQCFLKNPGCKTDYTGKNL